MEKFFSVGWRNPGHWDICNDKGRVFRIRGEGREVWVDDERSTGKPVMNFHSVAAAMSWITDQLMTE